LCPRDPGTCAAFQFLANRKDEADKVERTTSDSSSSGLKRKVWDRRDRHQQIQDDADSKRRSLREAGLLGPDSSSVTCRASFLQQLIEDGADSKFRNETLQQQVEEWDNRPEGRLDRLEKRVRVLEKKEKRRESELNRLKKENTALHEVVQDFVEGEDENLRCDREIAIKASQQWNDTTLGIDSMQSSSATTCREEYSTRSKARSAQEKLTMLQRVGTVYCVIFVGFALILNV
jgi:hypothetical protein